MARSDVGRSDAMRQQMMDFLHRDDVGPLPPNAVAGFVRFCYEMDALLDQPSPADGVAASPTSQGAAMRFVMQGCDKLIKNALDGLGGGEISSGPCGRRIAAQEHAYKCLDCAMDPTCVMCVECFQCSPCVHHNFRLVKSGGGSCDCFEGAAHRKRCGLRSRLCSWLRSSSGPGGRRAPSTRPKRPPVLVAH